MLPKAHLTLHSRLSGYRWEITPLLSESWRFFLYSSFVCYCHIFLISFTSVRSIPFLSFIVPIFAWNVPFVSLNFFKRSLAFPILFFPSISLHWSLWGAFLSLLAVHWNSALWRAYLFFSPLITMVEQYSAETLGPTACGQLCAEWVLSRLDAITLWEEKSPYIQVLNPSFKY